MNDYIRSPNPAIDEPPPADAGPPVIAEAETAVPDDPKTILAQKQERKPQKSRVYLMWAAGALVALELVLPADAKPSAVIGDAAARFYGAIQEMGNFNQLSLEEERILAHMEAERRSEYGAWLGRCSALGIFDPQAGAMCRAAAEAFYEDALREIERARRDFLSRTQ
jgi:hypothetical protein